jgi:uncharacterized protein (TIGR02646 family)
MILVHKSNQVPEILSGDRATDALNGIDNIIRNGRMPASSDFNSGIFNGAGVKAQLLADQYHKCAYCEVKMTGDYGAVEHYRPKTGWKENDADQLHRPGYYWLAYEWTNLLCSCDKCNSAARKGNLFPLRDPATRDIPCKDISREVPLIINPTTEDPGQYLRFNEYMAVPAVVDGKASDKGSTTINTFDLNGRIQKKTTPARVDLLNARKERWDEAKTLFGILIDKGVDSNTALNTIRKVYANPKRLFSGMFVNQNKWF